MSGAPEDEDAGLPGGSQPLSLRLHDTSSLTGLSNTPELSSPTKSGPAEAPQYDDGDDDEDAQSDDSVHPADDILQETMKIWSQRRKNNYQRAQRDGDQPQRYNIDAFLYRWTEEGTPTAGARTRRLAQALMNPSIRDALKTQGITIISDDHVEEAASFSSTVRKEMKMLIKEPAFGVFEPFKGQSAVPTTIAQVCDTTWLDNTLKQAWPTLKKEAPNLVTFLSQVLQNQRMTQKELANMDFDDEKSPQIFLLASLFTGGYARNNSSFLRDVLGLYMLAATRTVSFCWCTSRYTASTCPWRASFAPVILQITSLMRFLRAFSSILAVRAVFREVK
ncbi:hypothetical protein B0T24DRAFT_569736 [Lasiosphaeria ovina]|nr:hypothetical protein B0T24DRAFT_569736 [Lasiosphaeria ovina]